MKKFKRILALGFVILICVSLCSCNFIDELRSKQAFYDTPDRITFRDEVYIKLPECDNLKYNAEASGNVTTKDVPVLLSNSYGQHFSFNNDLSLLRISKGIYYVREDLYDQYYNVISNKPTLDRYCISGKRDNDYGSSREYFEVVLSDEAKQAIDNALLGEKVNISDYWDGEVTVKLTDEKGFFLKTTDLRIRKYNGKMYVLFFNDGVESTYSLSESVYDELNKFFSYDKDSSLYYY